MKQVSQRFAPPPRTPPRQSARLRWRVLVSGVDGLGPFQCVRAEIRVWYSQMVCSFSLSKTICPSLARFYLPAWHHNPCFGYSPSYFVIKNPVLTYCMVLPDCLSFLEPSVCNWILARKHSILVRADNGAKCTESDPGRVERNAHNRHKGTHCTCSKLQRPTRSKSTSLSLAFSSLCCRAAKGKMHVRRTTWTPSRFSALGVREGEQQGLLEADMDPRSMYETVKMQR
eukprot:884595-Rhodomonas_salina.2